MATADGPTEGDRPSGSGAAPPPNHLRNVAILGALGGLSSCAVAMLWLNHRPHFTFFVDPILSTVLGAGAGIVYVFLIANTDRNDRPRLVALALLAGFFWEPVVQAASALIEKQKEETQIAAADAHVQEAIQLAQSLPLAREADKPALAAEIKKNVNAVAILASKVDSLARLHDLTNSTAALAAELEQLKAPTEFSPGFKDRAAILNPMGSQMERVERALQDLSEKRS